LDPWESSTPLLLDSQTNWILGPMAVFAGKGACLRGNSSVQNIHTNMTCAAFKWSAVSGTALLQRTTLHAKTEITNDLSTGTPTAHFRNYCYRKLIPTRIQNAQPTHDRPLQRHDVHKSDRPHQPNNALAASGRSFLPPPCLGRSAERKVLLRTGQCRIHWGSATEISLHRNHRRPSSTMYGEAVIDRPTAIFL